MLQLSLTVQSCLFVLHLLVLIAGEYNGGKKNLKISILKFKSLLNEFVLFCFV